MVDEGCCRIGERTGRERVAECVVGGFRSIVKTSLVLGGTGVVG